MNKWKKISLYAAVPLCGALTVINFGMHMSHGHHEPLDTSGVSYMKIRNKPFPWSCPDCGLFDNQSGCWDRCKAAKAA